jgi:hypothetical protein
MKFLLTSIFFLFALASFSQRNYYVLIESEKNQPFYVRMGDNNYSSSAFGHVILSGLSDSAYTLEIGFPKDEFPASQFVIRIKKKDHGFQLKNLPDKGWVLFDYQTLELIYPIHKQNGTSQTGYSLVKRNDSFSKLLSRVVNDTSVLYTIVYDKPVEPPVPGPSRTVDSPIVKNEDRPRAEVATSKLGPTVPLIVKVGDAATDSGRQLTYMDNHDSVRIFINAETPEKKTVTKEEETKSVSNPTTKPMIVAAVPPITKSSDPVESTVKKEESPAVKKEESPVVKKEDKPVEQENNLKPKDTLAVAKAKDTPAVKSKDTAATVIHNTTKDTSSVQKKLVIVNSDCKAIAWDNDVDKLRIKMLAGKDVDDKIGIARKVFKTKCFSSVQIKGLTELFTTDEEKYKFLDAAYPFVVDTENFKELSYILTDPYYLKRFRAMVRLD